MSGPASLLAARIDATISRMAAEGKRVRAIYLTLADRRTAVRDGIVDDAEPSYRGYPVRITNNKRGRSLIYSTFGVASAVRS